MNKEKRKSNTEKRKKLEEAIKLKCIDCLCGQKSDCEISDCSLYLFRPYKRVIKSNSNKLS